VVHVQVIGTVPGRTAADVFPVLCDFENYSKFVEAVRSITVAEEDGRYISNWEVDFHGGVMRWKEEDVFVADQNAIQFRQLEGDLDSFSGEWRMTDQDGACRVDFHADFDLGVPGLSETLEPIAEGALRENVHAMLVGLLGQVQFE